MNSAAIMEVKDGWFRRDEQSVELLLQMYVATK